MLIKYKAEPLIQVGTFGRYLPRYKTVSELTEEERRIYLRAGRRPQTLDEKIESAVYKALEKYF